jgi:hypothetical protein
VSTLQILPGFYNQSLDTMKRRPFPETGKGVSRQSCFRAPHEIDGKKRNTAPMRFARYASQEHIGDLKLMLRCVYQADTGAYSCDKEFFDRKDMAT